MVISNQSPKKIILNSVLLSMFFSILFFPAYCSQGVIIGTKLFFNSLLPSILPFLLFSNLVLYTGTSETLGKIFYPVTHSLFRCSYNGSYIIVLGFLCGFPVGSKILCDMYKKNKISSEEAHFIFSFINHASPAFVINYISIFCLENSKYRLILLILIYLPEITVGIIYSKKYPVFENIPAVNHTGSFISKSINMSVTNVISTLAKIGMYVVSFSIISNIIKSLNFLNMRSRLFTISCLELTSGISELSASNISPDIKIFLCSFFTILCSVSTLLQINYVIYDSSFSIKELIKPKLLCIAINILLFTLLHSCPFTRNILF